MSLPVTNGGMVLLTAAAYATSFGSIAQINSIIKPIDFDFSATYQNVRKIYTAEPYVTQFTDYQSPHLSDVDKLAIVNDLTENITVKSTDLTELEHSIISDNLLDLL